MKFGLDAILDSFQSAYDSKKILFAVCGFLLALIGLGIFMGLGMMLADNMFISIPLMVLGHIWLLIVIMGTYGGIARMAQSEILGKGPISAKDAFVFAKSKIWTLTFAPILLILAIVMVIAVELLISWILSLIPVVGPIVAALLVIPVVGINLLISLMAFLGLSFLAPVIASDELGPINAIKKVLSLAKKEPIQMIIYLGLFTLSFFIVLFGIMIILYLAVLGTIAANFPIEMQLAGEFADGMNGFLMTVFGIAGVSLGIILLIVLGFLSAAKQTAMTRIYLILKERLG